MSSVKKLQQQTRETLKTLDSRIRSGILFLDKFCQKDSGVVRTTFGVCGVDRTAFWVVEWIELLLTCLRAENCCHYSRVGIKYKWYIVFDDSVRRLIWNT